MQKNAVTSPYREKKLAAKLTNLRMHMRMRMRRVPRGMHTMRCTIPFKFAKLNTHLHAVRMHGGMAAICMAHARQLAMGYIDTRTYNYATTPYNAPGLALASPAYW